MSQKLGWTGERPFTIVKKITESLTVISFYLKPNDNSPLPAFRPGQFVGISMNIPGQSMPINRRYTLSSSPMTHDYYRLSIKREPAPPETPSVPPGIFSNFMHDCMGEGAVLNLRAPVGDFVLRPSGKGPVVLLAGGIGCTPLISMLSAVAESGSTRDIWFIHGVRNGREHAFGKDVRALARKSGNIRVHIRYSRPTAEDEINRNYDSVGHVDMELLKNFLPGTTPIFYLCGATPFMQSLYQGLTEWGVDPFQINYEFFGPASNLSNSELSGIPPENTPHYTHKVTFRRSGFSTTWSPKSGSLLELAEASGVKPDFVCRSGACQTCLSHVIKGTFSYCDNNVFPPQDDSAILICSSYPTSDLVLDL